MNIEALLNEFESLGIAEEQWGQWATAIALDRVATMLGEIGCRGPNSHMGMLEHLDVTIKETFGGLPSAVSAVADAVERMIGRE